MRWVINFLMNQLSLNYFSCYGLSISKYASQRTHIRPIIGYLYRRQRSPIDQTNKRKMNGRWQVRRERMTKQRSEQCVTGGAAWAGMRCHKVNDSATKDNKREIIISWFAAPRWVHSDESNELFHKYQDTASCCRHANCRNACRRSTNRRKPLNHRTPTLPRRQSATGCTERCLTRPPCRCWVNRTVNDTSTTRQSNQSLRRTVHFSWKKKRNDLEKINFQILDHCKYLSQGKQLTAVTKIHGKDSAFNCRKNIVERKHVDWMLWDI